MNNIRYTRGVTQSGVKFYFHDDWTVPASAHRFLDVPWIGSTVFFERGRAAISDFVYQSGKNEEDTPEAGFRWSDLAED